MGKVLHYNTSAKVRTDWESLADELGATDEQIERHTTIGKPGRMLRGYWSEK